MKHLLRILPIALPLLLSACGGDMKQSLGLDKEAPDEFVVVSRPPLTLPPDFELRPPASGTDAPTAVSPEADARQALLGTRASKAESTLGGLGTPKADTAVLPVTQSKVPAGATASFLNKAGAGQADPDIRSQLGQDAAKVTPTGSSLYENVAGKKKPDTIVDPTKEAARIQENKQDGKPVTDGDTPSITPKEPSVLDRIF